MKNKLFASVFLISSVFGSAFAADVSVDQSGQKFSPDSLTIKSGDTVVFTNKDSMKHNINIVTPSGDSEDKGIQAPGEDLKTTLTAAGEYQVRCKIHPKMKMTITVQ